MQCVDDSLLQMLVEGTLEEAEDDLLLVHVRACPACRNKVSGYKQLMWDLEREPKIEAPAELEAMQASLMAAWTEAQKEQKRREDGRRSLVPAWAGYTLLWTRHAAAPVERVGGLLSKVGGKLVQPLATRRRKRKGGGRG